MRFEPAKFMRTALVASSTMLAIVVMWVLETKFEGADRKAALGIVHEYRAKSGVSIPDVLETMHPGAPSNWSVETQSACRQLERVRVDVAGADYEFLVDINGPSIHPGNPAGEAVLRGLDDAKGVPAAPSASARVEAAP